MDSHTSVYPAMDGDRQDCNGRPLAGALSDFYIYITRWAYTLRRVQNIGYRNNHHAKVFYRLKCPWGSGPSRRCIDLFRKVALLRDP